MPSKTPPYKIIDLTPGRRVWLNMLDLPGQKHTMYGLLEVDVTRARQHIAEHKTRTGETLSFTGFLITCLARAVDENKEVQAYLKGKRQLLLYDDVDVAMMVEHQDGVRKILMGHVIRGANHKTYREIHDEIRSVQAAPLPANRGMPNWFRTVMLLPWPLPQLFKVFFRWLGRQNPALMISNGGTVVISSVGMFGEGHNGWGIYPLTTEVLGLLVGTIAWKPAVIEGQIVPREMLNLTVTFDHEVVDGAPAARFTRRLVELIESGYGLDEVDSGAKRPGAE